MRACAYNCANINRDIQTSRARASLDDLADLDLERMRNTKTHSMDSAQACHSLAFRHCSSVFHGAAEPCVLLWFPCLVDPPTVHAEMLKSCIYAKCIPPPPPHPPRLGSLSAVAPSSTAEHCSELGRRDMPLVYFRSSSLGQYSPWLRLLELTRRAA